MWFLYTIVMSVFAAYIAGRALPPGTAYLQVFRFAGADRVHRLLRGALADVDLVSPRLDDDDQIDGRRSDLCVAYCRRVRLAVA